MNELILFRQWCVSLGHYQAQEAVDRYLQMMESIDECGIQLDVKHLRGIKNDQQILPEMSHDIRITSPCRPLPILPIQE